MKPFAGLAALLLALLASSAVAAPPFAGEPTRVMVLGTPHLERLPKSVDPKFVGLLLDRLAATKPDFIAIEGLSGEQCDLLRRHPARYPDVAKQYCPDTSAAEKATGLSVPAAIAACEKTLAAWPAAPTPAQRRALAGQFAAAGERPSALVQWLRLPPEERRAGDGLDAAVVAELEKARGRFNESYVIGAALAARLGHERVFPVDDHTSDSLQAGAAGEAMGKAMEAIWKSPAAGKLRVEDDGRIATIRSGEDLLAYYRWTNEPATGQAFAAIDQDAALLDASPEGYGRQYVAWWETRNLRMVANIRAVAGGKPGARVLAIVGNSHKAVYERYLGMMNDVRVESTEEVLGERKK